jgi:hypothetical protein
VPNAGLVGGNASAASQFLQRLSIADAARVVERIDGGPAMTHRPASPSVNATPIGTNRDRRVDVVVIGHGTVPASGTPQRGRRAGELIEQGAELDAGENLVAVEAPSAHAAIA